MAIQYVGGRTATKAGATSGNSTISLTALTGGISSSAAAGDIVIAAFATGSATDRTLSITDGTNAYTLIGSELYANGTNDTNLRVAYKVLTGADASVTFGPTGNAADAGAMAVHVWRGINTSTPLDVTATTATGTGTGRPNPPAITPSTTGAIVIAVGGSAAGSGAVFTSSDLGNFRTASRADTFYAMIGIGSYAWTSGAFDPAQFGGGTTGATDSWAAITLALRPAVAQTVTPSLFENSNTFYTPAVTAGAVSVAVARYDNTNSFYDATVAVGAAPITVSLFQNTNTFYAPALSFALTASRYDNANAFYGPTLTRAITVSAPRYDNINTFYSPAVAVGARLVSMARFDNANAFYGPSVARGTASVLPTRIESANTFYGPIVARGTVTITPTRIYSTSVFYGCVVGTGGVVIDAARYDNTNTFYGPTIAQGAPAPQTVSPTLFTNGSALYGPSVRYVIAPALFQNSNTFHASAITTSNTLRPGLLNNSSAFPSATVSAGPVSVYPARLTNGNGFYPITVVRGVYQVAAPRVENANTFYAPDIKPTYAVSAPFLVNTQAFYAPTVERKLTLVEAPLLTNRNAFPKHAVYSEYPDPANVADGVEYGPTFELTGTKKNAATWLRRR